MADNDDKEDGAGSGGRAEKKQEEADHHGLPRRCCWSAAVARPGSFSSALTARRCARRLRRRRRRSSSTCRSAGQPGRRARERIQYLKVKVVLEVKEEKQVETSSRPCQGSATFFKPTCAELRASDLNGSAGLFRLKEELTRRVNVAVAPNSGQRRAVQGNLSFSDGRV